MFVSKHGGQSEIVLRVKQGDNPTFGFLMPDHHLHPYFRFLVDHNELLDGKSQGEKKDDNGPNQTGGALSLLGSVYGSGEDEDGTTEDLLPEAKSDKSRETVDAGSMTASYGGEQMESSGNTTAKNDVISNHLKEKVHVIKRNRSINTVRSSTTSETKRDGDSSGSVGTATSKSQEPAIPSTSKVELPVLEPPSELKRVVEKIVEFILRNGKEFEAVLAEQDRKFGRFPFLLPSNPYNPYYLKVLQKTQESKLAGKGRVSEKHESMGHGIEKKTTVCRESDALTSGSIDADISYDYDKKEKFRMVLGKSKKDGQDPPPKVSQPQCEFTVDADAAAAILKAATSGIKNPSLELFPKLSGVGIGQGPSNEGRQSLSLGSLHTSQPQSSVQRQTTVGEPSVSVPVAKAMAETAARTAANEADSSEASLTREQKLKAERLKRAKMFAAMVKSGAAPLKPDPLRSLSVEPAGSGISSSGNEVVHPAGKEREGSLVPADVDTLHKIEKSKKITLVDNCNERRSKRIYRSRTKRDDEEEEEELKDEEDERDHKDSRKKHRSHRLSSHSRDRHKHRKRHSSKDIDSQHRHKHDRDEYSDDEDQHSQRRHKHNSSSDDSEHQSFRKRRKHHSFDDDEHCGSRRHHRHVDSSDDEHRRTRRRRKHGGSSDDEGQHRSRSIKHRKHHSEREVELEEGEICAKSDQSKANESEGASREASVDLLKSHRQETAPSQPSETTEVSDDLRAKIRAMLMATL
ncbi:protein suppressor of white apricot isoform X2 [Morus notabilis]|nr:protein suppressor of white apricot isoform X2 [Morus notabilis]XP_024021668.1 protein suppressor of white apricot isoform X2 [Morus notabilis]XP_024021669.1 protein suppressor of white apricot isoform X2 [Morus notabilis]